MEFSKKRLYNNMSKAQLNHEIDRLDKRVKELERKENPACINDIEDLKYQKIFQDMQDVYFRSDMDGYLVMISPSGVKLLGYETTDEMMGLNIPEKLYAQKGEKDRFLTEIKVNGRVSNFEVRLKTRDRQADYGYYQIPYSL